MTKQYDEQVSFRCTELHRALNSALIAIEALIDARPMLAAKVCGSNTLGNLRVEIKTVLSRRVGNANGQEFGN